MNSSDNAKPVLVLICFLSVIALFAGGIIGNTDLTPDTPPAPGSSASDFSTFTTTTTNNMQGVWTSGAACSGMYVIQSGDTLSKIARLCGIELKDLIAANPGLGDPNLIRPGQTLYVPAPAAGGAAPQTAAGQDALLPDSGGGQQAQPQTSTSRPGGIPDTGLFPGETVEVLLTGFPSNAKVQIGLGREGEPPTPIGQGITDAEGRYLLPVTVSADAREGERWVATVTTEDEPKITVISPPFVIGSP